MQPPLRPGWHQVAVHRSTNSCTCKRTAFYRVAVIFNLVLVKMGFDPANQGKTPVFRKDKILDPVLRTFQSRLGKSIPNIVQTKIQSMSLYLPLFKMYIYLISLLF